VKYCAEGPKFDFDPKFDTFGQPITNSSQPIQRPVQIATVLTMSACDALFPNLEKRISLESFRPPSNYASHRMVHSDRGTSNHLRIRNRVRRYKNRKGIDL